MKQIKIWLSLFLIVVFFSCTKLDEQFRSELEQNASGNITAAELLTSAYSSLNDPTQGNGNLWALLEISTDAAIAPTRGPDWDDNGQWRMVFSHTWNASQDHVTGAFNQL